MPRVADDRVTVAELHESRAAQLRRLASRPCIGWMDAHELLCWATELEVGAAHQRKAAADGARMLAVALQRLTPTEEILTPSQHRADLVMAGMTPAEVAEELGVSKQTVYMSRRKHGVKSNAQRGRRTMTERNRAVLAMYQGGSGTSAIAEVYGISKQRVSQIVKAEQVRTPA